MNFTIDKIQACDIFVKDTLVFHPVARIKAEHLYTAYKSFLERVELQDSLVEKHNFWSLLKQVVPVEVRNSLTKRNSRDLYYIGLDLKEHTLSQDKLKKLQELGIQQPDFDFV